MIHIYYIYDIYYIYVHILYVNIYIGMYIYHVSIIYDMHICFSLSMFSGTNLLNIHRCSRTNRIIGTKIGAHNSAPLCI